MVLIVTIDDEKYMVRQEHTKVQDLPRYRYTK